MQSADSFIPDARRSLSHFLPLLCTALLITAILAACSSTKEVKTDRVFDPEKSFSKAVELIDNKDYEEARKLLLQIKNRDLSKKYAPYAQLKIADSYVKEEEYEPAVEEYKKFLEIYPDHKEASYAQYQIAMAYFVQIEGYERGYGAAAKALEEFEKLKRMFPRNPYREVIELRIEKCKDTIADYEFYVGKFYFDKGSYDAALGRFLEVLSSFPEYRKGPQLLFDIAMCYKRIGDTGKAGEYLNRLIKEHPDDRLAERAKKEIQRAQLASPQEEMEKPSVTEPVEEAKKEAPQASVVPPQEEMEKPSVTEPVEEAKKEAPQASVAPPQEEMEKPTVTEPVEEAKKEAPQANVVPPQEEMEKPSVTEPVEEAKKEAPQASVVPPPEELAADVNFFIEQYSSAYESGDIERFISFYSKSAVENGMGYDDIRQEYRKNFEAGPYTYTLTDRRFLKSGDYIMLSGYFIIRRAGRTLSQGTIRWTLATEEGILKILKVEY